MTLDDRYQVGRGPRHLSAEESVVARTLNPEDPTLQEYAARQAGGTATAAHHKDYVEDAES